MSLKTFSFKLLQDLLSPVHPFSKKEICWSKEFEGYTLSLSVFSIEADMKVVCQWIESGENWTMPAGTGGNGCKFLQDANIRDLLADDAQVLLLYQRQDGTGDVPVAQVSIVKASDDMHTIKAGPDDGTYIMQIILDPGIPESSLLYLNIIEACLDFFFGYEGIEKILCFSPRENDEQLLKSGFTLTRAIQKKHYTAFLFSYLRK